MEAMEIDKQCTFFFPAKLISSMNGFNFVNNIFRMVNNNGYDSIIFDFNMTYIMETNLIAVLAYIIEKIYSNGIEFSLKLNNKTYINNSQTDIQNKIFDFFSYDKSAALMPRKLGNRNIKPEEKLLIEDLKGLRLYEYDKIRIIISELIANLKMHTIYKEGTFAGYHDYKKSQIIFSIANYDITIADQGKHVKDMEFANDFEAILWALRKNNTTRQEDESGGIGLFLLRKYISQLNGRFTILSGEWCLECDRMCYDPDHENSVHIKSFYKLRHRYEGTIITLFIPDKVVEENRKVKRTGEIIINIDWTAGG